MHILMFLIVAIIAACGGDYSGIAVDEQQTAIITKIAITFNNYTSCVNNHNITSKSAKNLSNFPIKAVVVSYDCACTFSRKGTEEENGIIL